MKRSLRRTLGDIALSVGSALLLFVILVSIDERVRDQTVRITSGSAATDVARVTAEIRRTSTTMFKAASAKTEDHAQLMIFTLAAMVLFVFMVRT